MLLVALCGMGQGGSTLVLLSVSFQRVLDVGLDVLCLVSIVSLQLQHVSDNFFFVVVYCIVLYCIVLQYCIVLYCIVAAVRELC